MKKYYVNINAEINGARKVHHEECLHLPVAESRKYIGEFYSCLAAVVAVLKMYPTADCCEICCLGHVDGED